MFAVNITPESVASFDKSVQSWLGAVRQAAGQAAVGMAQQAFNHALRTSPQYSGTFVANWRMNIGSPDTSWDKDPLGTKDDRPAPFQIGSHRAIRYAKAHEAGKLAGFQLGQSIYVSNSTMGDENLSLALEIEEGRIKLRPVNMGAYKIARRARDHVLNRYKTIGRSQLAALQRIGT